MASRILTEDVVGVDLSSRPFKVKDSEGKVHEAQSTVIATGREPPTTSASIPKTPTRTAASGFRAVCDGRAPPVPQ
jgi:thioredoxin reductase